MNTDTFLKNIKTITQRFIANNYSNELQFFDSFWQVFSAKIQEVAKSDFTKSVGLKPANQIISEISLVRENSLDLMTPVVMGVMAEIMFESRSQKLPNDELERIIASSAVRQGARQSLTACLLRNIPKLYNDLMQTNDQTQTTVFEITIRYCIWTDGTMDTVESIEESEKNKSKYLFWIDLDEKQNISVINPKLKLPVQPVKLLHYLIKHIGQAVSLLQICQDVIDPNIKKIEQTDIANIEANLSKLHKFSGGKFREYLFGNHRKAFGLKYSFKGKYFLFEKFPK